MAQQVSPSSSHSSIPLAPHYLTRSTARKQACVANKTKAAAKLLSSSSSQKQPKLEESKEPSSSSKINPFRKNLGLDVSPLIRQIIKECTIPDSINWKKLSFTSKNSLINMGAIYLSAVDLASLIQQIPIGERNLFDWPKIASTWCQQSTLPLQHDPAYLELQALIMNHVEYPRPMLEQLIQKIELDGFLEEGEVFLLSHTMEPEEDEIGTYDLEEYEPFIDQTYSAIFEKHGMAEEMSALNFEVCSSHIPCDVEKLIQFFETLILNTNDEINDNSINFIAAFALFLQKNDRGDKIEEWKTELRNSPIEKQGRSKKIIEGLSGLMKVL